MNVHGGEAAIIERLCHQDVDWEPPIDGLLTCRAHHERRMDAPYISSTSATRRCSTGLLVERTLVGDFPGVDRGRLLHQDRPLDVRGAPRALRASSSSDVLKPLGARPGARALRARSVAIESPATAPAQLQVRKDQRGRELTVVAGNHHILR